MHARQTTLALLAAIAGAFSVISSTAAPVHALSCAVHPNGTPEAVVSGTEQLSTNDSFFDRYDLAVTGTVTAIQTDDTAGSPTYGDTLVSVEVINAFGADDVERSIVVFQDDPGWMNGYAFDVGNVYFIPLKQSGPNGEVNYSFVCDPISQMDPATAALLPALATSSIAVAAPHSAEAPQTSSTTTSTSPPSTSGKPIDASPVIAPPATETAPPAASSSTQSTSPNWPLYAAVAVIAAAAALVAVRQRRRPSLEAAA